jgi:hypothetical protein
VPRKIWQPCTAVVLAKCQLNLFRPEERLLLGIGNKKIDYSLFIPKGIWRKKLFGRDTFTEREMAKK